MRIVADENCDRMIVVALREVGHDVLSVRESGKGQDDAYIFDRARTDRRIVLTSDLDFGRLCEHQFPHPPAIVVMRLARLSRHVRAKRMVEVLRVVGSIDGQLLVVEPSRIRIRAFQVA
jgi:predicted nuclease of predicted toxin-antitoxin system